MDTIPDFGFKELFTHVVGDMARALGERHGETARQKPIREHVASLLIMAMMPRDGTEAILAGHVAMFHGMITDAVHDSLLRAENGSVHTTRREAVALNKAFILNYDRLTEARKRLAEGRRDEPASGEPANVAPVPAAPNGPPPDETVPAETAGAETSEVEAARSETVKPGPASPETFQPGTPAAGIRMVTRSEIAGCEANPEAMAALNAADPERFARALGIKAPKPEYIAAAKAQMEWLNAQAGGKRPAVPGDEPAVGTANAGDRPASPARGPARE
jgi:hypothetical protein